MLSVKIWLLERCGEIFLVLIISTILCCLFFLVLVAVIVPNVGLCFVYATAPADTKILYF